MAVFGLPRTRSPGNKWRSRWALLNGLSDDCVGSTLFRTRPHKAMPPWQILKKQEMVNKNVVSQVMAERDILQFARNPFLINLYCSFTTKVGCFVAAELLAGR